MVIVYFLLLLSPIFIPLLIAVLFIVIYRKLSKADELQKDFISGIILLQGTREAIKASKNIFVSRGRRRY